MRIGLQIAWICVAAMSVMLIVGSASAQDVDAQANTDDRLKQLAEQLAAPQPQVQPHLQPAPTPVKPAAAVPAPASEKLPLASTSPTLTGNTTDLPRPTWGGGWVLNTATALGVVLLLIFGLRALLTRLGGATAASAKHPAIEVLVRTMVAPRNHVLLMRVGSRVLIVGDSPTGLRTLGQIDDPAEIASLLASTSAASPNSISRGFSQMLGRFNRDFDDSDRITDEGVDDHEHAVDRARDRVSSLVARMRSVSAKEARR